MDAKSRSRALRRELEGCFFRGNLPALIISVLCMLLLTGVNLVAAWLMQQLVDIVVSGGAGMGGILLTFAAAFAVFILAYDVQRYTCAAFVRRAVVQYKNFAFSGILERSVSFVSQENSAKFISILTNDVASIETNYLAKVFTLVMELAGFVGALGMMLWYSPILTAAAAVLALLPVGASLLCGDRLARCEAEVSAKNESYVETVKESFAGFSVIKSFRAEASVRGMFEQVSGSLEDAKYSRRKVNDLVYMLAGGAGFLAQFGVFIAAALLAGGGFAISAGVAVAFLQLMGHHPGYEGSIRLDGAELREIAPRLALRAAVRHPAGGLYLQQQHRAERDDVRQVRAGARGGGDSRRGARGAHSRARPGLRLRGERREPLGRGAAARVDSAQPAEADAGAPGGRGHGGAGPAHGRGGHGRGAGHPGHGENRRDARFERGRPAPL